MSEAVVLDASALLALLRNEPGGARVDVLLGERECVMSSVNLGEFVTKLVREGGSAATAHAVVRELPLDIVPFSAADAVLCGELVRVTAAYGLSLGDRACLAVAKRLGALAVTADRAWCRVDGGVNVECLRPEEVAP